MQAAGVEGGQEASALQSIMSWAGSSIQRLSFLLMSASREGQQALVAASIADLAAAQVRPDIYIRIQCL
jgi:hypothetical protein